MYDGISFVRFLAFGKARCVGTQPHYRATASLRSNTFAFLHLSHRAVFKRRFVRRSFEIDFVPLRTCLMTFEDGEGNVDIGMDLRNREVCWLWSMNTHVLLFRLYLSRKSSFSYVFDLKRRGVKYHVGLWRFKLKFNLFPFIWKRSVWKIIMYKITMPFYVLQPTFTDKGTRYSKWFKKALEREMKKIRNFIVIKSKE